MKTWKPIAAVAVAAVVYGLAITEVDQPEVDSPQIREAAPSSSPVPSSFAGESRGAQAQASGPVDGRLATAVVEPDGDEDEARQDAMSAPQRVRGLRAEFRSAVEALRAASEPDVARREAESALSALRGELYATASGRTQHQRLEAELDAALNEVGGGEGL